MLWEVDEDRIPELELQRESERIEALLASHEVDLDAEGPFRVRGPLRTSSPVAAAIGDDTIAEILGSEPHFPDSWQWESATPLVYDSLSPEESLDSSGRAGASLILSLDVSWLAESRCSTPEEVALLPREQSEDLDFHPESRDADWIDGSEGLSLGPPATSPRLSLRCMDAPKTAQARDFAISQFTSLPALSMHAVWSWLPRSIKDIFLGTSRFTKLFRPWSCGRPISLSDYDYREVSFHLSSLLYLGVISRARKDRAFQSYPFLVPKAAAGKQRLVIDYGHLKRCAGYFSPKFTLRPIVASASAAATLKAAKWFVKLDLRDAFYSIPIPSRLRWVSTFKFGDSFFVFNRLPMGLFISPYLLQSILRSILARFPRSWVHIDDILLWDTDVSRLQSSLRRIIRALHGAGFRLNLRKSILAPTQQITYCGLSFTSGRWDFTRDKIATWRRILRHWPRRADSHRRQQARGFMSYVLFAVGLSSAWLRLADHRGWRDLLRHLFDRLPRGWKDKPGHGPHWAVDAAARDLAVVDEKLRPRFLARYQGHINVGEMLALMLACSSAPEGSTVWCDSRVATAWRWRARSAVALSAVLSAVCVKRSIYIEWLPSSWNPADMWTRRHDSTNEVTPDGVLRWSLSCGFSSDPVDRCSVLIG